MKGKETVAASFTGESLRMLETEEGQRNAVSACFGSAAQHAQMFEQALARFLIVYNRIANAAMSVLDFDAFDERLQKKTKGWLLWEIQKYVTLYNQAVAERLDHALDRRNHLMHTFFLEHGAEFNSEAGRMTLLRELVSTKQLLDDARITINAMRIAMCRTLGIPGILPMAEDNEAG